MISEWDAKIAIMASGCEITKNDLIKTVNNLDEDVKEQIYLETECRLKKNAFNLFDRELMKKEIKNTANNFHIHPAVLYYVYMARL